MPLNSPSGSTLQCGVKRALLRLVTPVFGIISIQHNALDLSHIASADFSQKRITYTTSIDNAVDCTHAGDEIGIECISEERFWQFTQVEFEQTSDDMNVAVLRQLCCHFTI